MSDLDTPTSRREEAFRQGRLANECLARGDMKQMRVHIEEARKLVLKADTLDGRRTADASR